MATQTMNQATVQTTAKQRCRKHNWLEALKAPALNTTDDKAMMFFARMDYEYGNLHVCEHCGAIGLLSNGRSRGGGRRMLVINYNLYVDEFRASMCAWNKAVESGASVREVFDAAYNAKKAVNDAWLAARKAEREKEATAVV